METETAMTVVTKVVNAMRHVRDYCAARDVSLRRPEASASARKVSSLLKTLGNVKTSTNAPSMGNVVKIASTLRGRTNVHVE